MLVIDKLDSKTFALQEDGTTKCIFGEPFYLSSYGDLISIRSQVGSAEFHCKYQEMVIDGKTFDSVESAVCALGFLGNFKRGGGSSPSPTPKDNTKPVLFYGYDGTLLHSFTLEEARSLTALPALPVHDLIEGTSWTHTLEQINNVIGALHVGAVMRTKDGKTHILGRTTTLSGAPTIVFKINGTATFRVDWGDGSHTDTSVAAPVLKAPYTDVRDFHITIERIAGDGTYTIGGGGHSLALMGSGVGSRATVSAVFIGDYASVEDYTVYVSRNLQALTFPDGIVQIPNYMNGGRQLSALIVPNGVTRIGMFAAQNTRMEVVVIPESVTEIGQSAFNACTHRRVVIPSGVTNIAASAFAGYYLQDIVLKSETPPMLENTNAFINGDERRKYYVPDASVNDYKTAENWSTYAEYIYPISEMR